MNQMQMVQQKRFQSKSSGKMCQGFYFTKLFSLFLLFFLFWFIPSVFAENTFIFSTEPQSIAVGEMSGKINVQSASPVTETTYLNFTSSSATGQFLNGSGNPLTSSYISSGDSNRAVYYKDTTSGDFIITAVVLSKDKTQELATITQHIIIGGQSGGNTSSTATTTTTTTQNQTENNTSSSSSSGSSAHSSPAPLSNTENKMEFEISAGRDRLTSVGSEIVFQSNTTKLQNMSGNNISYFWSFGDGTTGQGNSLTHTYRFAGEYAVVVNASYSDKQAVARMVVKVIDPKISLNRVDRGTEVSNNSGVEINLENWSLIGQTKKFVFPKDTLLPNGKRIVFADQVTGINNGNLRIENPLGKKYAEISDLVPVVLGVSIDTQKISEEIEKVKNTLAKISPEVEKVGVRLAVKTVDNYALPKPKLNPTPILLDEPFVTSDVSMNVATVFEAPKSRSIVNTIFSLPIAGFNFIRGLFVEE